MNSEKFSSLTVHSFLNFCNWLSITLPRKENEIRKFKRSSNTEMFWVRFQNNEIRFLIHFSLEVIQNGQHGRRLWICWWKFNTWRFMLFNMYQTVHWSYLSARMRSYILPTMYSSAHCKNTKMPNVSITDKQHWYSSCENSTFYQSIESVIG